jgi:hypothetical protein
MAKFNSAKPVGTTKAKSHEGGDVYTKTKLDEWLNMLFSCYLEDGAYGDSPYYIKAMRDLTQEMVNEYGPTFVARCAFFARNDLGIRSVSQLVAAVLNDSQFENKRSFYRRFCDRVDDTGEVFSACDMFKIKRSHAMIRGFRDYLNSLSERQVSKYTMKRSKWPLINIVRMTHAHSDAIEKLVYENIVPQSANSINAVLTQNADDDSRREKYKELIDNDDIGYLMLIRSLNHIWRLLGDDNEYIEKVCALIANEGKVWNSKVFPYQIYSAYKNYAKSVDGHLHSEKIDTALEKAFRYSCANVPTLHGNVALVLDVSGSMESALSERSDISILEASASMCAAMYFMNPNATFYKFADRSKSFKYYRDASMFDIIEAMSHNDNMGGGTFISSFYTLVMQNDMHYDTIVLFSDMQIMDAKQSWWWGDLGGVISFDKFREHNGPLKVYSFDLGNYHTQIAPQDNSIRYFTSLSKSAFDFIQMVDNQINIKDFINEKYQNAF